MNDALEHVGEAEPLADWTQIRHYRWTLARAERYLPTLAIAIATLAMYLPVVAVPYAFFDDYWISKLSATEIWTLAAQGGRPLQGGFLGFVFSLTPDLDSLRVVRLVSLIGIASLASVLYVALRRADRSRWFALCVAISVISLPSFQVYASWAVLASAPYAAVLGGVASLRLSPAICQGESPGTRRCIEAATLLLCALFIYQPAAMFYWVFAAIAVLRPESALRTATRVLKYSLVVGSVAMILEFIAVKIAIQAYGPLNESRSQVPRDFIGKLDWFVEEPLRNSLNLFELRPTTTLALAIAILAACGIVLLHASKGWRAFGFLAIAAIFVPLTYLPSLAVDENWASYRSTSALSALIALYAWLGLLGIWRTTHTLGFARTGRERGRPLLTVVGSVCLAGLLSFLLVAMFLIPLRHLPGLPPVPPSSIAALQETPRWEAFTVLFLILTLVAVGGVLPARPSSSRRALQRGGARARALVGIVSVITVTVASVLVGARNVTSLFATPQMAELSLLRSKLKTSEVDRPSRIVFMRPHWSQGAAPLLRYDEFGQPSTYGAHVAEPAIRLLLEEQGPVASDLVIVTLPPNTPLIRKPDRGTLVIDMHELTEARVPWRMWDLRSRS